MSTLPPSPFIVSSALSMDVSAAAATSPPAPLDAAAVINSSIAEPEKSGESKAASARAASSPQLRAPVEPAAVEVGCGQAPEFSSRAKATEGKAGTAVVTDHVRPSTTGTGLRVGGVGAVRPTTSEFMDVTAGRDRQPISDPVDHPTIPPTPDTADDASASPLFSFDPGPCGIDFESELDMLEFELLLVGIPINARTFFTEAVNEISPASGSSA